MLFWPLPEYIYRLPVRSSCHQLSFKKCHFSLFKTPSGKGPKNWKKNVCESVSLNYCIVDVSSHNCICHFACNPILCSILSKLPTMLEWEVAGSSRSISVRQVDCDFSTLSIIRHREKKNLLKFIQRKSIKDEACVLRALITSNSSIYAFGFAFLEPQPASVC